MFEALPDRQSTRSEYDRKAVSPDDLAQVQALPLELGVVLQFVTRPSGLETVLEYVIQGNLRQYADKAFVSELVAWLRFNKKEALASLDGLYSRCTGDPEAPCWLGKLFVSGTEQQQPISTPGGCAALPAWLWSHPKWTTK